MGISQVPPVPTPVAKGDIVVGTASGPTRLPVSTTANQTLLVDTTTTTGLKYGSTTLTATHITPPSPVFFNVSTFSYTNPNVTITTTTNHNFTVGNQFKITGMTTNGTAGLGNTNGTVTAVTANTFTFNFGATSPGSYVSGGVVYLSPGNDTTGMIYTTVGGVYFILFDTMMYYYSSDAINWNLGFLPGTNGRVVGVDYDGSTYVALTQQGQIFSSTTAATGSWTQRYSSTVTFTGVKWCGGNTNRWVAYGNGSASNTFPGTDGRIVVTSTATGTWTDATIGGTSVATGFVSLGFDGNQTIVLGAGGQIAVTTNATSTWTGYATGVTTQPNSVANQIELGGAGSYPLIFWNSTASKWMAMGSSSSSTQGISTSTSPTLPWTKTVVHNFVRGAFFSTSVAESNLTAQQFVHFDSVNQRFYSWDAQGPAFNIYTYNANPTSLSTYVEQYPLISIASAPNIPNSIFQNAATAVGAKRPKAVYGNGKWVFYIPLSGSNQGFPGNGLITVLQ
jgi:hypothetical protein